MLNIVIAKSVLLDIMGLSLKAGVPLLQVLLHSCDTTSSLSVEIAMHDMKLLRV